MPAEKERMMTVQMIPFRELKQGEFFIAPDEEGVNRVYQLRQQGVGTLYLYAQYITLKEEVAIARSGNREIRPHEMVVRFSLEDPN